jgi:poly(3-hydroxybutyrate) depolymerase
MAAGLRSSAAGLLACWAFVAAAQPLPALHADPAITASGVSSGGYMAVQLHVAHSARIAGAGVIAGGPYYCAHGSVLAALYNCMTPGWWTPLPRAATLKSETDALSLARRIDPVQHLAKARVWLFSGKNDRTVYPEVVEGLRAFYAGYGAQVTLVSDKGAGHGMVTETHGKACATTEPPFIVDCDYDAAGALLNFMLGKLHAPGTKQSGSLIRFDQNGYAGGDAGAISMDVTGFAYVPQQCEKARCRIHVAFHGCRQGRAEIGEQFVLEAGYNRWADTNALIVLYPQAIKRYSASAWNPRGCWDWWGYTGASYHTQSGPQIRAVKAMLDRLSEQ